MLQLASNPHRRVRRGGFTLLEMLVVGIIGVLVLEFLANGWRWYARQADATHVSTQLTRELKLAAESVAEDYGSALASRTVDGTTLQINIDAGVVDGIAQWTAPDTVLEYAVDGGKLMRRDLTADTELTIADHIAELSAEVVEGKLQVQLTAQYRQTEHELTLQLEGP